MSSERGVASLPEPGIGGLWAFVLTMPVLVFFLLNAPSKTPLLAAAGAVGLIASVLAVVRIWRDPPWVLCALPALQLALSATMIPESARVPLRYVTYLLFCLPLAPAVFRSGILRRGGFALYAVYFAWALASVSYSIAPAVSFGRLLCAVLMFIAVVYFATEVKTAEDIARLVRFLFAGFAVVVALLAVYALVAPHDIAWSTDEVIPRFRGFFESPNSVGEVSLVAATTAIVCWRSAGGWRKLIIGFTVASALVLCALADSRSSFAALMVGIAAYLALRYQLRTVISLFLAALLVGGLALKHPHISRYMTREVGTLTGRTQIWRYALGRLEQHPLVGYGYEVEGEIFRDRHFPIWWGPWSAGRNSSPHNHYVSIAIGLGVPALLLWLFVHLRTAVSLFARKDDPWDIKPMVALFATSALVLCMTESIGPDCLGPPLILLTLVIALAERQRLAVTDDQLSSRSRAGALVSAPGARAGEFMR